LSAHHKADACVCDGTIEGPILGHKGFVWAEITTEGPPRRQRWDLGVAPSLTWDHHRAPTNLTAPFSRAHASARGAAFSALRHCSWGGRISTYAPSCTLQLERRTLPGESTTQVMNESRSIASAGEKATVCLCSTVRRLSVPRSPYRECVRNPCRKFTTGVPEEAGVAFWDGRPLFRGRWNGNC